MYAEDQGRRSLRCLICYLFLTVGLLLFLSSDTSAKPEVALPPVGPPGYTFCSNEYQFCNFTGTASVAYGANGVFVYRTLINGTPCNNSVFGDPIYGTVKACFYLIPPPTPPTLQFGSNSYSPAENSTTAAITVTRTGSSLGAVSAVYAFQNYGNATGGSSCTDGVDYVNTGGTVNFADGDTAAKTINITLCNDTVYENDEYFYVNLINPTGGAVIGPNSNAYVLILDDESVLRLGSSLYYGSDGIPSISVKVWRGGRVGAVSASYAFTDGTAVGGASCAAGVDYVNTGGTVSFADGDNAEKSINVPICNDATAEALETLSITLSNPTGNMTLATPSAATVVIRDTGAVTFTVNELGDAGDGICDATCTLRDALEAANGDSQSDDTIVFDAAVFAAPQTIILTNWLGIADEVTINGAGADRLSVSGNYVTGVFYVSSGVTAVLDGITVRDGYYYYGSGIYNNGTLTLKNSTVTGNIADYDGVGGGIANIGTMTILNSTVSGNVVYGWDWGSAGGGIFNDGTLTINQSTVSGNLAEYGSGGGIFGYGILTITDSNISGNSASFSGGGVLTYSATLKIQNSTISGNSATYDDGGGIYSDGTLNVSGSTISNNSANGGGGIESYGTLTVASSTISGNSANGGGGGIESAGGLTVRGSTISGNSAVADGGGIRSYSATETLYNTIVAGNRVSNSTNAPSDIFLTGGTIETASHNLIGDAGSAGGLQNGVNGNIVGVNPLLAPLRKNGGSTMTNALRPSSRAINAGNSCVLTENGCGDGNPALSTDQRGMSRNGAVDIGAFERQVSEPTSATPFDFDGDGKADPSVFGPANGNWQVLGSQAGAMAANWGLSTDKLVPGDYDGDGKTDVAIYRDGTWWVMNSNGGGYTSTEWGIASDVPVPADYDGDGKADLAIYRGGTWWILYANGSGYASTDWGIATDIPVPADYDGDGKADIAVFRNGTWWILNSNGSGFTQTEWGVGTDVPVPADYDGDGKTDLAVFRNGTWWVLNSGPGGGFTQTNWGIPTDKPVPADYDGDGKADLSIYRDGDWWTMKSNGGGHTQTNWGIATDIPIPRRPTN